MLLTLATLGRAGGSKSGPRSAYETLTRFYLERIATYSPCHAHPFKDEAAFLEWLARPNASAKPGRVPALAILLDSRGKQFSSLEFASWLGARRDQGVQHLVFAIGPHDGWSPAALEQAHLQLSLGPMTMAHELAQLALAEQLYRANTILANHPYHSGH